MLLRLGGAAVIISPVEAYAGGESKKQQSIQSCKVQKLCSMTRELHLLLWVVNFDLIWTTVYEHR
jgi:hypothetical protein